jgi:hypothetical protein
MTREKTTFTTIPAQPGWSIADFAAGDRETPSIFLYDQIVAWEIERVEVTRGDWQEPHVTRFVQPIAVGSPNRSDGTRYAIRSPDGKFIIPDDADFDTEADALKHFENQSARAKELAPAT